VPHLSLADKERSIVLAGVRTHNLKSIDLELPLCRLIVVTGPSGAGKSSLAFDTLYAEGQRRYIETFSTYSRQFLARMDRPPADRITGIPPAIAAGGGSRLSRDHTVGSITEVRDALALLFARAGRVLCMRCGQEVTPASPTSVSRAIDALGEGTSYEIAFPVELQAGDDAQAVEAALKSRGFTRTRQHGQTLGVIVDRLVRGKDPARRRLDSIETAFDNGAGRCVLIAGVSEQTFARGWRCSNCGTSHLEPRPSLFHDRGAEGACPVCEGLGQTMEIDFGQLVAAPAKTIKDGALATSSVPFLRRFHAELLAAATKLSIPLDMPFRSLEPQVLAKLEHGGPDHGFTGIKGFLGHLEHRAHQPRVRAFLNRVRRMRVCPACHGTRLRPEALAVKIEQHNVASLSALSISDARSFLARNSAQLQAPGVSAILAQLESRLGFLSELGLDYLALDRPAATLSTGERKRVDLTKTLATGLVNTLYVLDEPTTGLHPSETGRLTAALKRLRDQRNTLLVVEHDPELIGAADHIVDLGPGAGAAGGQVLYSGPLAGFWQAGQSATSDYASGRRVVPAAPSRRKPAKGLVRLGGACGNNLQSIDVTFPLGVLCVVTGVSGAGKSTLVEQTLYPALRAHVLGEQIVAAPYRELAIKSEIADVVFLDQSPLPRAARSNPATHVGAFGEIRSTFAATHEAELRSYDAGRFSFNVEGGRCNTCQGRGFLAIDMQFLPDVIVRCSECQGTRYRPEVLEVTYRGKNIAEVLDLTAREAFSFFRNRPKVQARLRALLDMGLDYLRLGQPVSTLSGGEAQRLKLAGFLAKSLKALRRQAAPAHTVFLLDEPSAGLHPLDILKLLEVLNALVDRGQSLIVIEHNPEIMKNADWIVDLGPGAGAQGGQVVAAGTPEEVAQSSSPTGKVLARTLAAARPTV
jgi:excinuclease ABC subunit A